LDDADRAQVLEEMERDAALTAVLARHKSGQAKAGNGACEDCGSRIPAARRLAVPWATRCVECASIAERNGGHT
jgi:phage/conjugal plasmid C-4 type zinc finger TraR family protein